MHPTHVAVIVLGDLGRSPRMVNQARALAAHGAEVWIAGYSGTSLESSIETHPQIHVHRFSGPPEQSRIPFLTLLFRATFWLAVQHWQLFSYLMRSPRRLDAILVQNPPGIPTLAVAWLVSRLRGAKMIVDWHNFGHCMLAMKLGETNAAVRVVRWYERVLGRKADGHLCVSAAMRNHLIGIGIAEPIVLYDRPLMMPQPRRPEALAPLRTECDIEANGAAVAVCPTSWTVDEDIGMLLEAIRLWDDEARAAADNSGEPIRGLTVLVTGRGALKDGFARKIQEMRLQHAFVRTRWFTPEAYHQALKAADLGICMHRSASGVDLPMKISDFFAAGLPFCALDYGPCLAELVEPDRGGQLFSSSHQLASQLLALFHPVRPDVSRLATLRDQILNSGLETWAQTWQRNAAPLFPGLGGECPKELE